LIGWHHLVSSCLCSWVHTTHHYHHHKCCPYQNVMNDNKLCLGNSLFVQWELRFRQTKSNCSNIFFVVWLLWWENKAWIVPDLKFYLGMRPHWFWMLLILHEFQHNKNTHKMSRIFRTESWH
jgi:hypothetical protein